MIRLLAAALLLASGTQVFATGTAAESVVAQERQPQQKAPKRDCEKRQEGVS